MQNVTFLHPPKQSECFRQYFGCRIRKDLPPSLAPQMIEARPLSSDCTYNISTFPRVSTVHAYKQVYIYACQIFFVCPSLGLRGVCAPDFGQIIQSCTTIMKTSILCKILSRLEIVAFKRSTQSVHMIDANGVRNMSQTFSFG